MNNPLVTPSMSSYCGEWTGKDRLPHCFYQVADTVYHQDPLWIPESREAVSAQFYHHNPYFNDRNRVWVGVDCGKARLAGFFNPDVSIEGQKVAYFGYFESVAEEDTIKRLFAEFEQWAKSLGVEKIYGPINFTTFGAYRIRLNHFEHGNFPGEPYNPDYYPQLLSSFGYQIEKRFYSWFGLMAPRVPMLSAKLEPMLKQAEEAGMRFVKLTPEYWLSNIETIYQYVDDIFKDNFAYTGIALEAFVRDYGKPFASKMCPKTSVLVLDKSDEIAGFFAAFPDYSPLLRQGVEERVDISKLNYEDHFALLKDPLALGKSGGVHPKYRSAGLFTLMSYMIMKWSEGLYTYGSASMVREDNPSANTARMAFSLEDDWMHEYALYGKTL